MYQTRTSGGGVKHGLHAMLTIFTFGMWAPIWILLTLVTPKKTRTITAYTPPPQPVYYPQPTYQQHQYPHNYYQQ